MTLPCLVGYILHSGSLECILVAFEASAGQTKGSGLLSLTALTKRDALKEISIEMEKAHAAAD
jgi:hypothetical protein